ncbi:hypothetical protein DEO72_LG7g1106 [Vigna unguiculata]|uniref:Uncharacterized protein n=1 Tax=Vigna unguiculata TaxID=3917 RepID=A0A4D6MGE7_VIGUN|nr:hypothetical protein DEO72_LG7g1106 [Vigna unguiculata]
MEAMATAPEEPPRAACSGGGGRLNKIAVAVGDGCSKNKHAAAPVVGRRRRSRGGAVLRRNDALERRRCAGWWELYVGGVRDGGSSASEVCETMGAVRNGDAELRWLSEKGRVVRWWLVEEEEAAAVRCRQRNAGLKCRRCA